MLAELLSHVCWKLHHVAYIVTIQIPALKSEKFEKASSSLHSWKLKYAV